MSILSRGGRHRRSILSDRRSLVPRRQDEAWLLLSLSLSSHCLAPMPVQAQEVHSRARLSPPSLVHGVRGVPERQTTPSRPQRGSQLGKEIPKIRLRTHGLIPRCACADTTLNRMQRCWTDHQPQSQVGHSEPQVQDGSEQPCKDFQLFKQLTMHENHMHRRWVRMWSKAKKRYNQLKQKQQHSPQNSNNIQRIFRMSRIQSKVTRHIQNQENVSFHGKTQSMIDFGIIKNVKSSDNNKAPGRK